MPGPPGEQPAGTMPPPDFGKDQPVEAKPAIQDDPIFDKELQEDPINEAPAGEATLADVAQNLNKESKPDSEQPQPEDKPPVEDIEPASAAEQAAKDDAIAAKAEEEEKEAEEGEKSQGNIYYDLLSA